MCKYFLNKLPKSYVFLDTETVFGIKLPTNLSQYDIDYIFQNRENFIHKN